MFWCCIYSSLKKQDWSIHLSFFCLCLAAVSIDSTAGIKMLYVFVDIQMDNAHFLDTIKFNFSPGQSLALVSTIQFVAALQVIKRRFCQTLCAFVCDSRVGESWRTQLLSLVFSILHKEYIFLYSTGIHTHTHTSLHLYSILFFAVPGFYEQAHTPLLKLSSSVGLTNPAAVILDLKGAMNSEGRSVQHRAQ